MVWTHSEYLPDLREAPTILQFPEGTGGREESKRERRGR